MKFYQKEYLLFLLIIFFSKSKQNEEKKLERLENGIIFIINSINGKLADTSFFVSEFKKYRIFIDNLQILKTYGKNNEFEQEKNITTNEIYYKLKNIKLNFVSDLNIQLSSNTIKEKHFFIVCNFIEIKFKFIDNFNIEFVSSEIDYINVSKSKILSELEFFNEFNNKDIFFFTEEINDVFNLKKEINKIFGEKIKQTEKSINLLAYDMVYLFNNCTEIFDISLYVLLCDRLKIDKIINKDNFINWNKTENSIKLNKIILKGQYLISEINIGFNITCKNEVNHILFKYNKQNKNKYFDMKIPIGIKECKFEQENEYYISEDEAIADLIQTEYLEILNEKARNYYNNILDL